MSNKKLFSKFKSVYSIILTFAIMSDVLAGSVFELPEYKVNDNNFVNMASGDVYHSFTDVSIGGSMGLSHTVSNAVHDNYFGVLRTAARPIGSAIGWRLVTKGYTNVEFLVNADGTYIPHSDLSTQLEFIVGTGYVLTLTDGTEITYPSTVHYTGGSQTMGAIWMKKVVKPNGLTIKISDKNRPGHMGFGYMQNVSTNTGFQLKYQYDYSSLTLDSLNIVAKLIGWPSIMPKHVIGINNAFEYCSKSASNCALSKTWPTTTYDWMDGGIIGDSLYKVTDPSGRTMEYHYRALDDTYSFYSPAVVIIEPGVSYTHRLIKIKTANNDDITMNYEYGPDLATAIDNHGDFKFHHQLKAASRAGFYQAYDTDEYASRYDRIMHHSGGHKAINSVYLSGEFGVPIQIDAWDQLVTLERSLRNRVTRIDRKIGNGYLSFEYDERGNLTHRHEYADGVATPITTQAEYPATCSDTTRKTCNQPIWTKNARGNQTHYTYHAVSGQVATVTHPANRQGLTAQTRYSYKQKFATYKINNDTPEQSQDGIWLLSSESACQNSNYANGSCAGNDEVVTSYEYESGNLNLIGKVSTADGISLRSCYNYDIYGNQIGETQPKAGLTVCN